MANFLTEDQVNILRQTHRTIRDKKLADRIKSILMLHRGFTYQQISQALLLDEVTLRRYVKQFQKEGIDGLLEYRYAGGKTRLSLNQEQELEIFLRDNTKRTAKEIAGHVHKTYAVKFSVIGVTKLLHRLGFSYKKTQDYSGQG